MENLRLCNKSHKTHLTVRRIKNKILLNSVDDDNMISVLLSLAQARRLGKWINLNSENLEEEIKTK